MRTLNVTARDEHVREIESHIRTLKEGCRATVNRLPFRNIPPRVIIELVYAMTFWIHVFPAADGLLKTISPREIFTGVTIDEGWHCRIQFGTYVQAHEEHDNSMQSRTVGAIALRHTGNAQDGHYFLSMETGKRVSQYQWTEVPMPTDAIRRLHSLAGASAVAELTFGDRNNALVEDSDAFESDTDDDSSESDSGEEDEALGPIVNGVAAVPAVGGATNNTRARARRSGKRRGRNQCRP